MYSVHTRMQLNSASAQEVKQTGAKQAEAVELLPTTASPAGGPGQREAQFLPPSRLPLGGDAIITRF